jgi:hypothetical protein
VKGAKFFPSSSANHSALASAIPLFNLKFNLNIKLNFQVQKSKGATTALVGPFVMGSAQDRLKRAALASARFEAELLQGRPITLAQR